MRRADANEVSTEMAEPSPEAALPVERPRRGRAWARLGLLLAPVMVTAVVAFLVVLQRDPPLPEPITPDQVDVAAVSTETLESVIDTYRDDPNFADEMPGVRLVLAERYFSESSYDRAFGLYAEIIQDPQTRPAQLAVSLSRLAWIGWLTNGDTEAALKTLDESLQVDPSNAETIYIKGQILWCGAGDADGAGELFETVLDATDLPGEVREQVAGDLEAASTGAACL